MEKKLAIKLKSCKHGNQPTSMYTSGSTPAANYGYWAIECACPAARDEMNGIEYFEGVHAENEEAAADEWNNRPDEQENCQRMVDTLLEVGLSSAKIALIVNKLFVIS